MTRLNLVHRADVPQDAAGLLPAVVMLHGKDGNETVMAIFDRTLPAGIAVISPRAPFKSGGNGYTWLTDDEDLNSITEGLAALATFVAKLPEVYPVDPDQVALIGFSQGAALSYALALSQPGRVNALAGLAGFLPNAARRWVGPGRLAGLPVYVAHGRRDETVPVAWARQACEALRDAGANVRYHEYEAGHKMSVQGMADLKAWLHTHVPGVQAGQAK
jgi:phospholipase/carboxylesterase